MLQLLPGSACDPIKCSIENVNLYDKPVYEALSYCWGNISDTVTIYIDIGCIEVTRNLRDALATLRDEQESRMLWVDAVCINQLDIPERSHQVRIMRQIYEQSRETLVWLGLENEDTSKAFELVPYLLQVFEQVFLGKPRPIYSDLGLLCHPLVSQVQKLLPLIGPFIRLEERPYFSRIWIVQEVVVSTGLSLHWGHHRIPAKEYIAAASTFACFGIRRSSIHRPLGAFLGLLPLFQLTLDNNTLLDLLNQYRRQDSTDPRDKVFALLGLARDVSSLGCKADYSKTVVEVYSNLARSYIQRDSNLDIVGYVQHGSGLVGLPSWVPDWTRQEDVPINFRTPIVPGTYLNHNAGGGNDSIISISSDGKALNTRGVIIDSIAKLSGLREKAEPKNVCCMPHLWERLVGLQNRSSYIAGGTAREALFRTQIAGCPEPIYEKLKPRLQEIWDQAKTHSTDNTIRGSYVESFAEGSQKRGINIIPVKEKETGDVEQILRACLKYSQQRQFVVTSKGYYALAPKDTATGDQIAIVGGGSYPLVLRAQEQSWQLVGECYVHGAMNGDLFGESVCQELTIV